MAAPTQPPAPTEQPPASPGPTTTTIAAQPPAGWRSSEAWLTLLAVILGAIPSSGLVSGSPLAAKLVGMAIAALSVLGYQAQRTSLKRAHLAAWTSQAAVAAPRTTTAAMGLAGTALAVLLAWGCSSTPKTIAAGGDAFLQCGKADLTQMIGDKTLLATVVKDLASGDYLNLIEDLIGKVGADAVGCAVIAVDTVAEANAGSGSASSAALSPSVIRARELIAKHKWKLPPANADRSSAMAGPPPGFVPRTGDVSDGTGFANESILPERYRHHAGDAIPVHAAVQP